MRATARMLAASLIALAATACSTAVAQSPVTDATGYESATVKVLVPGGGHGSGVHLGNGYVLTAGHVSGDKADLGVQDRAGNLTAAEVLWTNFDLGGYDVSLIYVPDLTGKLDNIGEAKISCAPTEVGQYVRAEGNPLGGEFVTFWGRVAGTGVSGAEGVNGKVWRRVVTLDMAGAGGMSGGPVYDEDTGKVVGIVVAGIGIASPYMLMVPGDTICHVMGRTDRNYAGV